MPARLATPSPLVVYYHGGGHVIGDLDTHDQPCRFLARETPARPSSPSTTGCGPEHRFPAAVDDALAAFRWAHAEAAALGADPARIAVAGDSAGGNLAAVGRAARRRRRAGPSLPGPDLPGHRLLLRAPLLRALRRGLLPHPRGDGLVSRATTSPATPTAPTREPRRSWRPTSPASPRPTSLTAGFDPLRDEGEAYAQRLREAGVPTTLRREPDLVHGFINAVGLGGRAARRRSGSPTAIQGWARRRPSGSRRYIEPTRPDSSAGRAPPW